MFSKASQVMTNTEPVVVSQFARDTAIVEQDDLDEAMRSTKHMKFAYNPAKMAAGGYDLDPLVLSYARHRIAAELRGEARGLEKAAVIVVDTLKNGSLSWAGNDIASAIRSASKGGE